MVLPYAHNQMHYLSHHMHYALSLYAFPPNEYEAMRYVVLDASTNFMLVLVGDKGFDLVITSRKGLR